MINDEPYCVQVVKEQRDGSLIYPPNIPHNRGNTATILLTVLSILLWALSAYTASKVFNLVENLKYSYYALVINVSTMLICNFVRRSFLLFEELNRVHSTYDDSIAAAFKCAFQHNVWSIIVVAICVPSVVAMIINIGSPFQYLWTFQTVSYFLSLMSSILLISLVDINESKLNTILTLPELHGLDYGSGMAYSYFYGYLYIILPSIGTGNKGLNERIEQYEASEQVSVPVKKLFILIPTSLRTPPDLREASDNWMEKTKDLESVILDRGGVARRKYHNTVYKIHPNGRKSGKPIYVVAEGATPLLTFYEVMSHSGVDSTGYNDYRKEIVGSFYRTLHKIIKSKPEIRDLVELVYYEDYDPSNQRVNVAEILLRIIQPIQASGRL